MRGLGSDGLAGLTWLRGRSTVRATGRAAGTAAAGSILQGADAIKDILEAVSALFSGAAASTTSDRAAFAAGLARGGNRLSTGHSDGIGRTRSRDMRELGLLSRLAAAVRGLANAAPLAGAKDILPAAAALDRATAAFQAATAITAVIAVAFLGLLARLRLLAGLGLRRGRGALGCFIVAAASAEAEVILQYQVISGSIADRVGTDGNGMLVFTDGITPEHLSVTVLGNAESGFVDTVLGQECISRQSQSIGTGCAGGKRVVGADLQAVNKIIVIKAGDEQLVLTIGGSQPDASVGLGGKGLSFREKLGAEGGE